MRRARAARLWVTDACVWQGAQTGALAEPAPPERVAFDGFCVDATPAPVDWRAVQTSANIDGWMSVAFRPLVSRPLPLARRTTPQERGGAARDRSGDGEHAQPAAAQPKKPLGNLCFNCGERGHNAMSCPQPRDQDAITRRRKVSECGPAGRVNPRDKRERDSTVHGRNGNLSGERVRHGWTSPGLGLFVHLVRARARGTGVRCEGGEGRGVARAALQQQAACACGMFGRKDTDRGHGVPLRAARYFVPPSESKVAHVKPGALSRSLTRAAALVAARCALLCTLAGTRCPLWCGESKAADQARATSTCLESQ